VEGDDALNDNNPTMEEQMNTTASAPRRNFFGRAAGTFAIAMVGLTSARAQPDSASTESADWPGKLKGRHRQLVDAYALNDGFPLAYALTFQQTNPGPGAATSVVVLRHAAFPIALNSEMWAKYKIGEAFKIIDPETKAPAVKNPFLHPKPGVLIVDDMAIDRLLENGAVFGACHVALIFMSKRLASNAGLSGDQAAKEWAANLVPGVSLIPSGTWGVNRAQEAGCTYCSGG
jgi:hypothetical protein